MMTESVIQWDLSWTAEIDSTWWSNITCSVGYSYQPTERVLIELQHDNLTIAFCKLFSEEQTQGSKFTAQRVPLGCTFSVADAGGRYQCILFVFSNVNEYLALESDTIEVTNLSSASNTVTIVVIVVSAVLALLALVIAVALCMKKCYKCRSISYHFRESDSNQNKGMEAFNEIICE